MAGESLHVRPWFSSETNQGISKRQLTAKTANAIVVLEAWLDREEKVPWSKRLAATAALADDLVDHVERTQRALELLSDEDKAARGADKEDRAITSLRKSLSKVSEAWRPAFRDWETVQRQWEADEQEWQKLESRYQEIANSLKHLPEARTLMWQGIAKLLWEHKRPEEPQCLRLMRLPWRGLESEVGSVNDWPTLICFLTVVALNRVLDHAMKRLREHLKLLTGCSCRLPGHLWDKLWGHYLTCRLTHRRVAPPAQLFHQPQKAPAQPAPPLATTSPQPSGGASTSNALSLPSALPTSSTNPSPALRTNLHPMPSSSRPDAPSAIASQARHVASPPISSSSPPSNPPPIPSSSLQSNPPPIPALAPNGCPDASERPQGKNKRFCQYDDCVKMPTFNWYNEEQPRFCKSHMEEGMVDVKNKRKECEDQGCIKLATSNFPGLKPIYCRDHRVQGMVDVKSRGCAVYGCGTRATFGRPEQRQRGQRLVLYCKKHREEGMVDVYNKRCRREGCITRATFGHLEQGVGLFCKQHCEEGMVDVYNKRCREEGCNTQPKFGFPEEGAVCCRRHMEEGMEDVVNKRRKLEALGLTAYSEGTEVPENGYTREDHYQGSAARNVHNWVRV